MRLARARNLGVVASGVLLAASLTANSAHAGTRASNFAATATTAGMAAVAGGTVVSTSGTAMPDVVVDLYAWPSDAVLKAMKPGALVPTTLLAAATTSSAGKYMLQVPTASLQAAAVESGYANLEIFSAVGGTWFFSYQTSSLPARPVASTTINLSDKSKLPCGQLNHRPYVFKGWTLQRERNPAWAIVGQGYIVKSKNTAGDVMQFNYTQEATATQSSSLGVGVSAFGFDAGFNASGTTVSTAGSGQGFPSEAKSTWFRTEFSVGQYRGLCYSSDSSTPHQKQHGSCPKTFTDQQGRTEYVHKCLWLVKSTGWFGFSDNVQHPKNAPHTPGKFCGPELKGSTAITHKQKAIEWGSGWSLGKAVGIKGANLKASFNASSQTGYDTNAQIVFTFGHDGWVCGTNHDTKKAAILVVRGNKA